MNKHAQVCGEGIGEKNEAVPVDEGSSWGYRLDSIPGSPVPETGPAPRLTKSPASALSPKSPCMEAAPAALRLSVCAPRLRPIRGFTDRFSGIEWAPIFEVLFPAGSKNPEIVRNETGYEMDVLLSLIRAGRIVPISTESDAVMIRRVFPCIDVYSLQMFVHIYRNKGFSISGRLRPATEKLLFSKVPDSSEWKNCVRIYVDSVAEKRKRIYFLRRKTDPMKSFGTLEVSGDGKSLCQAKAFGNGRLDRRAQKFLVKWCRCKGIRIRTADISEVPFTA